MVATLWRLDGFEHNKLTARGTSYAGFHDAVTANATLVTSPVRTGTYALSIAAASAATNVGHNLPSGTRKLSWCFAVRFASLPGADVTIATTSAATNSCAVRFNSATTKFAVQIQGSSDTLHDMGATVSTNTWYLIDVAAGVGTSWTGGTAGNIYMKGRVDGDSGTEASTSFAQADGDLGVCRLGTTNTNQSFTAYYDDWAISLASDDYPIADTTSWEVIGLTVIKDGTHSTGTAGNFTDGTNNITDGTTTAWDLINEMPLQTSATDYIRQPNVATSNYTEHIFNYPSATKTILDVRGYQSSNDSATSGADTAANHRVYDSTGAAYLGSLRYNYDCGTTVRYFDGCTSSGGTSVLTRPASGWSRGFFTSEYCRFRVGFGSPSGTGKAQAISVMLEVAQKTTGAAQAIAATTQVSPVLGKQPRKLIEAASSLGAVLSKETRHLMTGVTSTLAPVISKQTRHIMTGISSTLSVVLASSKVSLKVIEAATTFIVDIPKQPRKLIIATTSLTAFVSKKMYRIMDTVASTLGVTMARLAAFKRTLDVAMNVTPVLVKKTIQGARAISVSVAAEMSRIAAFRRTLDVTSSIVPVLTKQTRKLLDAVTTTLTAVLETLKQGGVPSQTIAVTMNMTVEVIKQVRKVLDVVTNVAAMVLKGITVAYVTIAYGGAGTREAWDDADTDWSDTETEWAGSPGADPWLIPSLTTRRSARQAVEAAVSFTVDMFRSKQWYQIVAAGFTATMDMTRLIHRQVLVAATSTLEAITSTFKWSQQKEQVIAVAMQVQARLSKRIEKLMDIAMRVFTSVQVPFISGVRRAIAKALVEEQAVPLVQVHQKAIATWSVVPIPTGSTE